MGASSSTIPIAPGLFTWPAAEPCLLGSRCKHCNEVTFPSQQSCPACGSSKIAIEKLPRQGTLWSWTIQRFPPKAPYVFADAGFEPYGVGYIELPGAVCVEARLTENDPAKLRIGMPMQLVCDVFYRNVKGEDVVAFAFKPVDT